MITTTGIRKRAEAHYRQWLTAIAQGNPAFEPLTIQRTGDQKKADERWEALSEIVQQSKEKTGYGYRIELEAPAPNSKNKQSRLRAIVFDTANDLLQFIDKTAELEQFKNDCAMIAETPELSLWCAAHVREVLLYAAVWPRLLAVVRFFQENPAPVLPVRLLPIEGVDTKFIEQYNGVLCQLLDVILPHGTHKIFSKRYGLPEQAPLIECAWNDPALAAQYGGFNRLAFPADQLEQIPLAASRILVVENRNSMLQVLHQPFTDGIVIFGGGFGITLLKDCQWLHQKVLYYWGDLDAHGLAILSRFRDFFPNTQALMMDETTFDAYPHAWVAGKPYPGDVPKNLSTEERQLFERLNSKLLRLEQERVRYRMLLENLES
ncbi:MAG: hypothetical protein IT270_09200 [Saprospiraceae bacterium]|nr:hypothetical protein [Saprospiraceae bacterium]